MRLSTRVLGTTFAAAAMVATLSPAASAASSQNNNNGRGNLLVCVSDLNGREADIEVRGRSDRDEEIDGRCVFFKGLRSGWYSVELDAPRWCDDDREGVKVRSGKTSFVRFDADCPDWRRNGGGGGDWWNNDDNERGRGGGRN